MRTAAGSLSSTTAADDAAAADELMKQRTALERWLHSLMSCSSLSQIFLHLSVLDHSIIWDKSALLARCVLCRRKGDDEKMLLCDGCDNGYHMYCLKPPIKVSQAAGSHCDVNSW